MVFDRLDNDDGVIDHDTDRQNQPKSVRLFRLNPIMDIAAKVPTMATGTAASGMIAARQHCRNTSITMATMMTASCKVLNTSSNRFFDKRGGVVDDVVRNSSRKPNFEFFNLPEPGAQFRGRWCPEADNIERATEGLPSIKQI